MGWEIPYFLCISIPLYSFHGYNTALLSFPLVTPIDCLLNYLANVRWPFDALITNIKGEITSE